MVQHCVRYVERHRTLARESLNLLGVRLKLKINSLNNMLPAVADFFSNVKVELDIN